MSSKQNETAKKISYITDWQKIKDWVGGVRLQREFDNISVQLGRLATIDLSSPVEVGTQTVGEGEKVKLIIDGVDVYSDDFCEFLTHTRGEDNALHEKPSWSDNQEIYYDYLSIDPSDDNYDEPTSIGIGFDKMEGYIKEYKKLSPQVSEQGEVGKGKFITEIEGLLIDIKQLGYNGDNDGANKKIEEVLSKLQTMIKERSK